MDFPDLFRRSFALWWRVRALWVAGVLAALFGYGEYGASFNAQWSNTTTVPIEPGGPSPLDQLSELDPQFAWLAANFALIAAVFIVVGLIWAVVAGLVGALANGAMIALADESGGEQPGDLGAGMRAGAARMLPVFLVNLLLALPLLLIFGAIFALVGGLLWQALSGGIESAEALVPTLLGTLACALPLALIAIVLSVALRLLGRMAIRACVIEGRGPLASIGRGWGLLRHNLGPTLLLWLVLGVAGLMLNVAMGLPALALVLPIGMSLASGGLDSMPALAVAGLVIYGLVVNIGVGGMLTSLSSTIWTLHYRGLLGREWNSAI